MNAQPPPKQTVFITAYDNPEAAGVAAKLRRLHALSDGRHALADGPEAATVVLVAGIGNEMSQARYVLSALHCEVISRFADKCFTLSFRDTPVVFNRGIYESAAAGLWTRDRCSGGAYMLAGHWNDQLDAPHNAPHDAPRDLLCSFIGRMSHPCRREILSIRFERPDVVLEDSSAFDYWTATRADREGRERRFASVLLRSKFCLCPRGVGTGSIRLFEAMRAGVAPVVISDGWVRPAGIRWDDFCIFVGENELSGLETAMARREADHQALGRAARAAWETNFAEDVHFNYLVDTCAEMRATQKLTEAVYWRLRYARAVGILARKVPRRIADRGRRWVRAQAGRDRDRVG